MILTSRTGIHDVAINRMPNDGDPCVSWNTEEFY